MLILECQVLLTFSSSNKSLNDKKEIAIVIVYLDLLIYMKLILYCILCSCLRKKATKVRIWLITKFVSCMFCSLTSYY